MSLFKKESKIFFNLIISFKSSSIDLQLIKSIEGLPKKEVVFSLRTIILLENSQDPILYTKQYEQNLQKILSENNLVLKKLITGNEFSINLILYTPWFTSSLSSFLEKEEAVLSEEFLNTKIQNIKVPSHLQIIEKQAIKLQANGYTIPEISKVKSSNIKIDLYTSYISKKFLESFKEIISKYFSKDTEIKLTTSPMLYLNQIKSFMVREDNLTVLYIGGEITELHIIRDDSLVYFGTFPIGKHDFLRIFNPTIKSYDYELFNQKQAILKNKIDQEKFEVLKKNWAHSLCDLMRDFNQYVPSKLLIISDNKSKPFFVELLNQSISENSNSILKNHRIINFDISSFKDIISYNTSTVGEIDLILEALN